MTTGRSSRRQAFQTGAALAASLALPGPARSRAAEAVPSPRRIRQSVVHWCFKPMSVEDIAAAAARLGMKSVELVGPEHWPTLKKHGLLCAITGSHGFAKGFAHREEHDECLARLRQSIDATAKEGWPSVITFSGFRRGLSDAAGMRNMVEGLKKIAGYAEEKKVTLCVEMLNSKVNVEMKGHPDYFCDDIERTVEICRQVGSERVKVLFDIYHVQIMHGDVIARIRQHAPFIGHYHTAGNPGRNEIDGSQEIQYPPIMKAILATGYQGYVGQEFIPLRDKVASLAESVQICDVA